MWFAIALFIGGFILTAFLSPKPKIEHARASGLSEFKFPRSKEGDPVPRIYGTVKLRSPNTIGLTGFRTSKIREKVKTGMFSSKKRTIGFKYYATLDMAVALGPCVRFRRMWFGKHEVWNGCVTACTNTTITLDIPELFGPKKEAGGIGGTVALYAGNFDQPQDSYLASKLDPMVPRYKGVAHMVFRDFYWGNTPNVEPVMVEVSHFSNSLGLTQSRHIMLNGLDANPIEVLHDLYVNDWGNLDVNPALIDTDQWRETAYRIFSEDNGISLEIANPNTGGDVTREIIRQINAMLVQDPSTGLIRIKLVRADYNVATLPVFGPDHFTGIRNYTKKLWEETYNRIRIKYVDRNNSWSDAVSIQDDFANIRFQGRIRATDISMPGVYVAANANKIAARELSQLSVPLYQAELTANRVPVGLTPGDPFVLTWPEYGIVSMVVRIRKFGLGRLEDGKLSINIVQDEFATESTVFAAPVPSGHVDANINPANIVTATLFEVPYWMAARSGTALTSGSLINAFAVKPGTNSESFDAFIEAGIDDTEVMARADYARSGTLVAAFDKFAGFATGIVPEIEITGVDPLEFATATVAAIKATGVNLFYLNGEILAFEGFTAVGTTGVKLTNVHRSLLDTPWVGGAIGARVFFFDGSQTFFNGEVPLAAFTAYLIDRTSGKTSDPAAALQLPLTPIGRAFLAMPPDKPTVAGVRQVGRSIVTGAPTAVAWRPRSRLDAEVMLEDNAAGAAEAGTTYEIEVVRGATVLQTVLAIPATPYDLTVTLGTPTGAALIRLWAVKDAKRSFSPAEYPVTIVEASTLEIDADAVLIDGATVEFK